MHGSKYWIKIAILFSIGLFGIVSLVPAIPKLIAASGQAPSISMVMVQLISVVQSSVLLFAMVMLGAWLAPKVNLGTPLLDAYLNRSLNNVDLRRSLMPSVFGGILGGVLIVFFAKAALPHLPPEFIVNGSKFDIPIYTKILYGGITEELLVRWGLMSFFVWGLHRLTQRHEAEVSAHNYILAIFASAVLFGCAHLPAANMLTAAVTIPLIVYIVVLNSLFGLIAGYLFWKRGLESAMLAHMVAHVVMIIGIPVG